MLAKEAFSTKSFNVHRYAVARLNALHVGANSLYYAHHLVAYSNTRYSSGHTAVFNV